MVTLAAPLTQGNLEDMDLSSEMKEKDATSSSQPKRSDRSKVSKLTQNIPMMRVQTVTTTILNQQSAANLYQPSLLNCDEQQRPEL